MTMWTVPFHAAAAPADDAVTVTLKEVITETGIPGITFSFYGAKLSQSFAAGWADRERQTPMRPHAVMMGASTGKVLVAVLAYQEVARGRLHYSDKVSRYLGTDSAYNRLPGASRFTVQMLFTHSTGLIDGAVDLAAMKNSRGIWTNQRRFKAAWNSKLLFEPGTAYGYSDLNYQILAAVVESIEGQYFGDLALSRVIEPLGMSDTAPATSRVIAGLASGYAGPTSKPQYENIKLPDKTAESGRLFMSPAFEGGGGGFSTSAPDLAKFMYSVFATPIIGPSERAHMTADFVPLAPPSAKRSYGAGVFRYETALGVAYGHSGVWFGYKTQVQYFPALCVAAAMQVNSQIDGDGNDLSQFKANGRRFGMPEMLTELMTQAIAQTGVEAQCGK
jgi:D-alanyl-D-alanine carboxypeptidase